ncbi:DsbA family protein [Marinitenerispora sediminis]|uniref:Disulfide bond formation protein DsbA n=1 Tax=Marinitenerispora sediminis TaxID=1931232 RepID=A0A368T2Q4_9ACTN|nr:thioredoxin domain-containing protein [Marinitenerispora sediminis]RCV49029.1 disulfide bond formation protein DsbA [Marinitenerispora sediminis]RCV51792.1 disulfide bond formation protein DsbA [Marinitenerispora sediminis]RCV55410.1 disulfide bond formation protein DsbA [Marinitenerispora sediminis]
MTRNLAITLVLIIGSVVALGLFAYSVDRAPAPPGGTDAAGSPSPTVAPEELLIREDSHYLSRAEDSDVTVVEFLDFECEACRAQFPVMERIREEYDGRINFVIRYFPLPGHTNSEPAAAAVEAAAEQDALEEMYMRMYETQAEWGESREPQADVFVGFAEDLGLDVERFTATMEDPATLERVRADFEDGVELGVQGTPTIYVNGRQTESMPSYRVLTDMIDRELGE